MYTFEFDPNKSHINLSKHGIDFIEAQELWNDPDLIEIPANTSDEPRALIVAYYKGKYWSAVVTYRTPNVRIISVRRARKNEVDLYESI
ncbi:BrnT family toxin [Thalassotalea euphylliae]|uniref:BrnT family toxin n=1 Tax=Thalassotalea euphylliae TaxID=1655234 RepID=A0A3E0TRE9_9GAMM|nr:BrnT family toxin [Thalassotalea euphylliae]REL27074.1 BrnT family toxin [Thalassotalea euphylliae]